MPQKLIPNQHTINSKQFLKKTSDEELLNLYQSNSEENLLNILLQRHMPQIRQNVRSLVCNKEDVEDLCQDIYSRILIKLRQGYYSNGHIQAWIYRIVQNYVYSFYRKKKHEFITQELTDLNIGDTWSDTIKEEKEKERILYVLMSILEKEPPQIKQIIKNECPHVPKLAKFKPPRCPIGVYWNTLCLMRDVWTIKTYMI